MDANTEVGSKYKGVEKTHMFRTRNGKEGKIFIQRQLIYPPKGGKVHIFGEGRNKANYINEEINSRFNSESLLPFSSESFVFPLFFKY
jgi:hypothetical protein